MRLTTVIKRLLGVMSVVIRSVSFEPDGLVVSVRPARKRGHRCGVCGRKAPGYDRVGVRRWRHLSLGTLKIWLAYAPHRVSCRRCQAVVTEQVPWARHRSRFTRDFEELTAYMAQVSDMTSVSKLMGISWASVGRIVERVVSDRLDPSRLKELRLIGVDEFGYRKRHRYVTTVVDHDRHRVVWSGKGRSAKTLEKFFDELGEEGCKAIEAATIDMAGGYIKAITERLPNAQIVFDRFHVQALASDALDEVRREQARSLQSVGTTEQRRVLKRSRYALLKNRWNLTRKEHDKLSTIQRSNAPLYRAYLLKESLAAVLDQQRPWRAKKKLAEWLAWASRSRLPAFVKLARTIRKRKDGILAYVHWRLTNGVTEGFNNRLRTIARRAFGFHSPESLSSMLFLCCGGIELNPPLPTGT